MIRALRSGPAGAGWPLLLLGLPLALLSARSASAETYLVAAGNNFGHEQDPALRYAEQDAETFARVLRTFGRVEPENEVILRGADASTLRGVLLRVNARIRGQLAEGSPSTLVVYYSGHADAAGLHLGESTLRFQELKAFVESSPAKVRVLVLDSCRSGGITQVKGVKPAPPFAIRLEDRMEMEGMAIIASSASSEDSQESESLRASFFTHHLVNALRGAADRDADGRITIGEAYSYAYTETLRSSGRTTQLQHPTYAYDIKGKGDYALTQLDAGAHRSGTLVIGDPGSYLIFEGAPDGILSAEVHVEEEGGRLLLPPGRYFVQRRSERTYREYDVSLARGKKLELRDADFEELTYSRLLRKGGGQRDAVQTLSLLATGRGPLLGGYGPSPGLLLGFGMDFQTITLGLDVKLARSAASSAARTLEGSTTEFGLRVRAEHFFDFSWFSASLGLAVEGSHLRQGFESGGEAPDRTSFALGFGAIAAIEREILPELILRAEAGPITYLLNRGVTEGGALVDERIATPLTWWAALGAGWRF